MSTPFQSAKRSIQLWLSQVEDIEVEAFGEQLLELLDQHQGKACQQWIDVLVQASLLVRMGDALDLQAVLVDRIQTVADIKIQIENQMRKL